MPYSAVQDAVQIVETSGFVGCRNCLHLRVAVAFVIVTVDCRRQWLVSEAAADSDLCYLNSSLARL